MKTHTIYIETPCSINPSKDGYYFTNKGELLYSKQGGWTDRCFWEINGVIWWLDKREEQIIMSKEEFENISK